MINKTQNHTEPGGIELLDLETAYRHDWNSKEYIRIAVDPEDAVGENGTISFILVQFNTSYECISPQASLNLQEIDIVINALLEAKARVLVLNAPNKRIESEGVYCDCNPNESLYKVGSNLCAICEKPRK